MKKCPKALKKRVAAYTETIFNSCVSEVFGLKPDEDYEIDKVSHLIRAMNSGIDISTEGGDITEFKIKKDKVAALYQERVNQLPTKQLNEILKAHNMPDGFRRAPKTIENIVSELARRSIFNDSNESEYTNDDGDMDGLKRKSAKHSKKTTSKRRKTSKGRSRNRTN